MPVRVIQPEGSGDPVEYENATQWSTCPEASRGNTASRDGELHIFAGADEVATWADGRWVRVERV